MISHSELHQVICAACTQVCEVCANPCDEMGDIECADICRKCVKSCRTMSTGKS